MDATKILEMIEYGELDDHLSEMQVAIAARRNNTREFIEWVEGDRVRINEKCRPKYLVGVEATIQSVRRTRVVIHLDKDAGRFRAGRDVTIPMDLLDQV